MTRLSNVARRVLAHVEFRQTATIVRQSPGARNEHGEWQPGATTEEDVVLANAPAGQERNVVPEGARPTDTRQFWMMSDVLPIRVGNAITDGDIIRYDGTDYRVRSVQDWDFLIAVVGVREEVQ